ncbi:glutathione S-transferase theta-1 isoform X2 [Falco biarmicus]|uniref:glutathione S-transferase theta-4 isoform X2 n=1 Tax=Falco cherrug TaxID=345164 RepID=UPI0024786236|nr:glutathione S-transferase theta-4 isoform X2 [Falco cherrug]XP_056184804.1 glutathione S-transferase theta-1 isoform X2 [Falco biarmicus]
MAARIHPCGPVPGQRRPPVLRTALPLGAGSSHGSYNGTCLPGAGPRAPRRPPPGPEPRAPSPPGRLPRGPSAPSRPRPPGAAGPAPRPPPAPPPGTARGRAPPGRARLGPRRPSGAAPAERRQAGSPRAGPQQHGAGAVPGPALAALPLHLHLRPQQQHPLRVQADSVLGKKPAAGSGAEQPRAGPSNSEGAGKVNLLKKVPALKDGDFTLAECTAILLYLSRKYNTPDHWYPSDIQKRAQVDEYLSWHHANIRANAPKTMWIKVLIPLFTGQPLPSEKLQEVMEGLSTSLKQFEERFLQDKAFIIGSEISLADLVAIVELMQPVGVGCDVFEDRPRLMEWRRRVEDAVGKELFFQAHEMILNIKEVSNIQIDPQLKEHLAPVLMKMLK